MMHSRPARSATSGAGYRRPRNHEEREPAQRPDVPTHVIARRPENEDGQRQVSNTPCSTIDCLTAQIAAEHGHLLLHDDRDFAHLEQSRRRHRRVFA